MHEKQVAKGCYVIREGEIIIYMMCKILCENYHEYSSIHLLLPAGELGSHFYVSAEGEYEVIKDGKVLGR